MTRASARGKGRKTWDVRGGERGPWEYRAHRGTEARDWMEEGGDTSRQVMRQLHGATNKTKFQ